MKRNQARVLINEEYGVDKEPYIEIQIKTVEGYWAMTKAYPINRMTKDLTQKLLNELHDLQFNYKYDIQFIAKEIEED